MFWCSLADDNIDPPSPKRLWNESWVKWVNCAMNPRLIDYALDLWRWVLMGSQDINGASIASDQVGIQHEFHPRVIGSFDKREGETWKNRGGRRCEREADKRVPPNWHIYNSIRLLYPIIHTIKIYFFKKYFFTLVHLTEEEGCFSISTSPQT